MKIYIMTMILPRAVLTEARKQGEAVLGKGKEKNGKYRRNGCVGKGRQG